MEDLQKIILINEINQWQSRQTLPYSKQRITPFTQSEINIYE